jgi:hypothetical protein
MLNTSFRRKIVLCLLLVTVLAVPWASAAGHTAPVPPDLFHQILSFFTSPWGETGCDIDPNGRCLAAPPAPFVLLDEGCDIDPNGRCGTSLAVPLILPDSGCNIDPDGRCHS